MDLWLVVFLWLGCLPGAYSMYGPLADIFQNADGGGAVFGGALTDADSASARGGLCGCCGSLQDAITVLPLTTRPLHLEPLPEASSAAPWCPLRLLQ